MARITVEDCLENVENRFELVMIASKRARQIQTGGKDPMVSEDNDKPTVLALREIAEGLVDVSILTDTRDQETAEDNLAALEAAQASESEEEGKEKTAKANQDISIEEAMDAVLVDDESEAGTDTEEPEED